VSMRFGHGVHGNRGLRPGCHSFKTIHEPVRDT
jgi:hypothetical protein